uniref:G-protein coupled receptors family 3 profile domain-containing protein n=1 Tax=Eptatretus burgeri TaxID=7764 RepID=A0A8C4X1N0_EPTBU
MICLGSSYDWQFSVRIIIKLIIVEASQTFSSTHGELTVQGLDVPTGIIVGGLFPVHFGTMNNRQEFTKAPWYPNCTDFNPRVLRWAMGMVFAIEEINSNTTLLSNVTLGYTIFDTCYHVTRALHASLKFMEAVVVPPVPPDNKNSPCAVIGDMGSALSVITSHHLGLWYIPQVSYFSSCKCLSDKRLFPSFLRTIPSDAHQASAIALLVNYFGWLYIGTLAAHDEYGQSGVAQFVAEAEHAGACIAFRKILPKVFNANMIQHLGKTASKVILVFATEKDFLPLVNQLSELNATGKTWIASEAWVTSPQLTSLRHVNLLQGTIGVSLVRGKIPGLHEYLTGLGPRFFHMHEMSLEMTKTLSKHEQSPVFNIKHHPKNGMEFKWKINSIFSNNITPSEISAPSGKFSKYELTQFLYNSEYCYQCPKGYQSNEFHDSCVRIPTEYLTFSDPLAMFLSAFALLGIIITMAIGLLLFLHQDLLVVKASSIDGLLLVFLICCYISSVVFIGKPSNISCRLHNVLICVFLTLIVSCILTKTVRLYHFNNISDGAQWTSVKSLLREVSAFLLCAPQLLFCSIWAVTGSSRPFHNFDTRPGTIILECADRTPIWITCTFLYLGILVITCLCLAINAGNKCLAMNAYHNEAKFTTFSMISFILVCLAFVPAYSSTQGKVQFVIKTLAVITTNFSLLGCIFVPRCYTIVRKKNFSLDSQLVCEKLVMTD